MENTSQQVREPEARFWVGLHGPLTSQRSLLTKSKRKVRWNQVGQLEVSRVSGT
jgi:hypothetical protein